MGKGFKVFIGIMVSLLVLIQAATLVFFIYGAIQIKQQAAQLQQTVNTKVDKFSNNTQGISQDLNAIKKELGQQKTRFGF